MGSVVIRLFIACAYPTVASPLVFRSRMDKQIGQFPRVRGMRNSDKVGHLKFVKGKMKP